MYSWETIRSKAIRGFNGETPGAKTEAEIIEVFEQHPELVNTAVERLVTEYAKGNIRSGWAVLRKNVTEQATGHFSHVVATSTADRERAIKNAAQWVRTAGIHLDREAEVADEIDTDWVKRYELGDDVRSSLLDLWRRERPRGVQVEVEEHERAQRFLETRHLTLPWLAKNPSKKTKDGSVPETVADQITVVPRHVQKEEAAPSLAAPAAPEKNRALPQGPDDEGIIY